MSPCVNRSFRLIRYPENMINVQCFNEKPEANDPWNEQHLVVKFQECKVERNLFTKVVSDSQQVLVEACREENLRARQTIFAREPGIIQILHNSIKILSV